MDYEQLILYYQRPKRMRMSFQKILLYVCIGSQGHFTVSDMGGSVRLHAYALPVFS